MDGMKDEWLRVFLDDRDQWGFIGNVAVEYHKKYIDYGYRTQKNVLRTASTLFTWHNETMNIWSHLIGFICAFVAISHYLHAEVIHGDGSNFLSSDQIKGMNTVEFLSCFSFYAAAATCFFFSSVYHWFQCMSPSCCKQLLSFDLAGIALLIGCSYFPAMYYAFECFPNLLNIYMCVSAGVTVVGLANQWLPVKYFGTFRPYIFAGLVLFGIVPLVHWALITPPAIRDELFLGTFMLFVLYGLGFTFFLCKFPENMYPNRFWSTILIPSHTLWHVFVLLAVLNWHWHLLKAKWISEGHGCTLHDAYYGYGVAAGTFWEPEM